MNDSPNLRPLSAEQRYRQALKKAQITRQRNIRVWMNGGHNTVLECCPDSRFIIAEMQRLIDAAEARK